MSFEPAVDVDDLPGDEGAMANKPEFMPRYPGSGRLAGKVALITGADSGIGRAVAVLFAREGADIAIAYLSEHGDAGDTGALVEAEGRRALLLPGDVGLRDTASQTVAATIEAFGRLDILVNNAAEQHETPDLVDLTEEQLRRTFQTNIFGYFFMAQSALPYLKAGAAIINTTSITSFAGAKALLDYSSTKGAITSFTRSLAANLVEQGIRVNGVAPGPIWTPLNPYSASPEKLAEFGKHTPMKRPGQPNEVAPAYLFLACDDASYITGQIIHPNGGEPAAG